MNYLQVHVAHVTNLKTAPTTVVPEVRKGTRVGTFVYTVRQAMDINKPYTTAGLAEQLYACPRKVGNALGKLKKSGVVSVEHAHRKNEAAQWTRLL